MSVSAVTSSSRIADLCRSINTTPQALRMLLSMIGPSALEGQDTPGKVRTQEVRTTWRPIGT